MTGYEAFREVLEMMDLHLTGGQKTKIAPFLARIGSIIQEQDSIIERMAIAPRVIVNLEAAPDVKPYDA